MAQFSVKIIRLNGAVLDENQHSSASKGVVRETWVAVGQGGPLAYLDDKTLPFPLFQGQP